MNLNKKFKAVEVLVFSRNVTLSLLQLELENAPEEIKQAEAQFVNSFFDLTSALTKYDPDVLPDLTPEEWGHDATSR
jgi:hypothetical protein